MTLGRVRGKISYLKKELTDNFSFILDFLTRKLAYSEMKTNSQDGVVLTSNYWADCQSQFSDVIVVH